jgi:Na+-transporting NADH:ubiquinone oxidoreductase subunit NqrD
MKTFIIRQFHIAIRSFCRGFGQGLGFGASLMIFIAIIKVIAR